MQVEQTKKANELRRKELIVTKIYNLVMLL